MSAVKKRGRGRPQVHSETKLMQFRVPIEVETLINTVISSIKVLDQDAYKPAPMVLIEALQARLKQLGNRNPTRVAIDLKKLDKALTHYEYVERLDKQRKAKRAGLTPL
jgi:hypothetical protein